MPMPTTLTTDPLAPADPPLEPASVTVTDRAAARISKIAAAEAIVSGGLRVSVEGGGCSGFQYKFNMVSGGEPDDVILVKGGATVLIDPVSLQYLAGSEIDFVDDLMGASFKVKNPNAVASCGCGTSFTL